MSFSSKSPSGSNGGKWSKLLYFDPESDKSSGGAYSLSDQQLKTKLKSLIDHKQDILKIYVYKTPLKESQWTNLIFHHKYICFETQYWWWSIQKNDEGLTLQRSKHREYVQDHYRRNERCKTSYWSPQLVKSDVGRYNLNELIDWLWRKDLLNNSYDVVFDNCKDFASKVFNQFAQTKSISPSD